MTASTKLKWAPNYQQDIDKINTKLKHYYDFYNRMVPDYESEPGLLGISFGGFGIATSIKEGSDYVAKFIINLPVSYGAFDEFEDNVVSGDFPFTIKVDRSAISGIGTTTQYTTIDTARTNLEQIVVSINHPSITAVNKSYFTEVYVLIS